MIVVSNTSPLRYLVEIDCIDVLRRLFGEIYAPPPVRSELEHASAPERVRLWVAELPAWVRIEAPHSVPAVPLRLHQAETEAIALALGKQAHFLLIDERDGRRAAQGFGVRTIGTLAVLGVAAELGHLDLKEALTRLLMTNFRIDRKLVDRLFSGDPQLRRLLAQHAEEIRGASVHESQED